MFILITLGGLFLFVIISIYLIVYSSYRIRNCYGFIILFSTFTASLLLIGVLPFCQIYLLYFLVFIDLDSFKCFYHTVIVFYCVIESLFYLFTIEEANLLNNRPLPKRIPLPKNYDEQFVDRISNVYDKSSDDFRVCFAGWFYNINPSSWNLIYEENILEYIAMSTYGVRYSDELTDKQQEHIKRLLHNGFLNKYSKQHLNIQSGYNNQVKLRHPYRDTIQYTHHPMLKYLVFACVRSIGVTILKFMGYEHQIIDDVSFYVRKKQTKTSRSSPILFLHGLSLGIISYILFISRLTSLDRTIILLDIPYASMRLHTEIFPISTVLSSIEQLLISLNEKHLITIGHSYGTFIQSSIVKQMSHIVYDQPAIFFDPVCFLLFDSRMTENFLHRKPRTPNQLLLHTFCAEDLYLTYALKRHVCWYECNLWAEDVKQSQIRIHVFLSENDDIIHVSFVQEYLKKSNIDTTVFPQFKHAQFLISPKIQDYVMETLYQLESKPTVDDSESVCF